MTHRTTRLNLIITLKKIKISTLLYARRFFTERLLSQIKLRIRDEKQKVIAEYLIGNLDESGYLRRELFNLVDDLAFSQNIITTRMKLK